MPRRPAPAKPRPVLPPREPFDPVVERALLLSLTLLVALRAAAALLDGTGLRLWGIDVGRWMNGSWDILLALLLPFAALLPPVRDAIAALVATRRPASPFRTWAVALLTLAAVFAVLRLLPVSFAFLGDGSYYAGEVYRCAVTPGYQPAFLKPTAWLTGHLLQWIAVAHPSPDTRLPFAVLGMAGAAVVFGGFGALLRSASAAERWLLASLLVFTAGFVFFAGYIELYALSYAFGALYLLAAWSVFRHGTSPWAAGLCLLAAIAFGISAAAFIPSFLLVLHWKFRGEGGPIPITRAALLLCVLCVLPFAALYLWDGISGEDLRVMPLLPFQKLVAGVSGGWQHYTLASGAHLLDVANVMALTAGPAVAVVLALAVSARSSSAWRSPAVLTGVVAAVGGLLFVSFGHAFLGLARDWDLAALPMLGVAFLAAALLVALADEGKIALSRVLPLLLLTALGGSYVWLRVNADEDASARRLQAIVELDREHLLPMNTYTALENLRKFYRSANRQDEHIATLKRMIESEYHKPDTYGKLLTAVLGRRDASARGADFDWIFARLRQETRLAMLPAEYRVIAPRDLRELAAKALLSCVQSGDAARAAAALASLRPLLEPWKEAAFVDVFLTPGLSPREQADRVGGAVDEWTADPALLVAAGRLQSRAGRAAEAVALFERAVALHPELYPETFLSLSQLYYERLLDTPRARLALQRCIAAAPDSPEAREAKRILGLMAQQP